MVSGVAEALVITAAAHHRTEAAGQHRTTDHADRGRRRGAEKRAATAAKRRRLLLRAAIGLAVGRLIELAGRLVLLQHLTGVPGRTAATGDFGRANVGHRTMRLVLPEDRVAHRIQETAGLTLVSLTRSCFQFLDARVSTLQRFVLHQCGLHQRIDGIGRVAQALHDRRHRLRIALGAFQLGEPVEKIVNQLAFLRCHGPLPRVGSSSTRRQDVGRASGAK